MALIMWRSDLMISSRSAAALGEGERVFAAALMLAGLLNWRAALVAADDANLFAKLVQLSLHNRHQYLFHT